MNLRPLPPEAAASLRSTDRLRIPLTTTLLTVGSPSLRSEVCHYRTSRLQPFGPCSIHPCSIGTSRWSRENVILISAPGIAAQLVVIEGDTEAGLGGHVDPEVGEAQRFLDQIVHEDLRPEMLAAPGARNRETCRDDD